MLALLKKIEIFICLKLIFQIFWCADVKNDFFKIKKILFWYISKWKTLWKATATTLSNVLMCMFKRIGDVVEVFFWHCQKLQLWIEKLMFMFNKIK
jgi:hypothetical protein